MSRTIAGGYRWTQLLAENRRRNRDVATILGRLERVATTDATKVLILQAQVMCTENLVEIEQLLTMAKGGEAAENN